MTRKKAQDSDDESDGPAPPLTFDFEDAVPYQHLKNHSVTDGVTKQAVDGNTVLATLYQFDNPRVDNELVQYLTRVGYPKIPCQVLRNDGQAFPSSMLGGSDGYYFLMTYNNLLLAPAIRLECHFIKNQLDTAPFLTLAVDFHFNDYRSKESSIQNCELSRHDILSLAAGPATCYGFGKIADFESQLTEEARGIVGVLQYCLTDGIKAYRFQLDERNLSRSEIELLARIRARLPGGFGTLLPSIGRAEYSCYAPHGDYVHSVKFGMKKPRELMAGAAPHPWVSLDCTNSFSTVKEAAVQLAYSAVGAHDEECESLRLWSESSHKGKLTLYDRGRFMALCLNFNNFGRLGSVNDELCFRLPKDIECSFEFLDPYTGQWRRVRGFLMGSISGKSKQDACFHITSHSPEEFGYLGDADYSSGKSFFVKCLPQDSCSTYAQQLLTVSFLQKEKSKRWVDILLNQIHETIPERDLTDGIAEGAVSRADEWLKSCLQWNHEQLQVIEGVKRAKGGLVIVMGPAGTGKTLLQQLLSFYFFELGFHVLALAPANSNCDHLACEVHTKKFPHFLRLYPASRDIALDTMSDRQSTTGDHESEKKEKKGHELLSPELVIGLAEHDSEVGSTRPFGVVEKVIQTADDPQSKLYRSFRDQNGKPIKDDGNAWVALREFNQRYRTGTLNMRDNKSLERYRRAYQSCKGHIISLNRYMITTTGNVTSTDMFQYWAAGGKNVIVFVDEATKDLEVNVWAGIVCPTWSHLVRGAILFGDDKQLRPTNTSSKGKVAFNAFNDRLDISLPTRLVEEGYKHFRLVQQRRMHREIARFANYNIYDGELCNGPGTDSLLDDKFAQLRQVLIDIQADHAFMDNEERELYRQEAPDCTARLAYIEVLGERVKHPTTQSVTVEKHVSTFFRRIYPRLRRHFIEIGASMQEYVMIICAYSHALHQYEDAITFWINQSSNHLTRADFPQVLTVDASQGQEAMMVIFDGSYQHGDRIGFMEDRGRFNVAITRAKDVFWTIGGSMENWDPLRPREPQNLPTKYKRELDVAGKTHYFR